MLAPRHLLLSPALAISVAALSVAGCGGGNDTSATAAAKPAAATRTKTVVAVRDTTIGEILTDADGRSLYLFVRDTGPTSTCSGTCAIAWPPFRADAKPQAGSGASAADIGTTARSDGAPQVTYNRHPLYFYAGDLSAGQRNGEGLTEFGGSWYLVSPAGMGIADDGSSVPDGPAYDGS